MLNDHACCVGHVAAGESCDLLYVCKSALPESRTGESVDLSTMAVRVGIIEQCTVGKCKYFGRRIM